MRRRDIEAVLAHYELIDEQSRLSHGSGELELARTQELLGRYLPPPPAVVLDVGGGPGRYSCWLARLGYDAHLIDVVAAHVDQAVLASRAQPDHPIASCAVGDARSLAWEDESADAVLLLGPLYHLVTRADRLAALGEARRTVKPGGFVFGAGISRFASVLDGLVRGLFDDPLFAEIVARDLADGQHRNPTNHPRYFTTAYFHRTDELAGELEEAGLEHIATLGIEGPGWLLQDLEDRWRDPSRREHILNAARALEREPSILGVSPHLLAIGRRPSATP